MGKGESKTGSPRNTLGVSLYNHNHVVKTLMTLTPLAPLPTAATQHHLGDYYPTQRNLPSSVALLTPRNFYSPLMATQSAQGSTPPMQVGSHALHA